MDPKRTVAALKFHNPDALPGVQLARPVTNDKYLSTTLILKAMIDNGLINASPNALYMLQEGEHAQTMYGLPWYRLSN